MLLAALLLGYVALEGGVAGWETTHLLATTDLGAGHAAGAVALFWLGLTVGRLVAAPLALRYHPSRLVIASLGAAAVLLAVAAHAPLAVTAYALTGFVIAPVFPAVIAWHAISVPSGRGATRVFAAGLAGPLLASPLIGSTTQAATAAAVPWTLAGITVLTTACAVTLAARRPAPEPTVTAIEVSA